MEKTLSNQKHTFFKIKEKHHFHLVDSYQLPFTAALMEFYILFVVLFFLVLIYMLPVRQNDFTTCHSTGFYSLFLVLKSEIVQKTMPHILFAFLFTCSTAKLTGDLRKTLWCHCLKNSVLKKQKTSALPLQKTVNVFALEIQYIFFKRFIVCNIFRVRLIVCSIFLLYIFYCVNGLFCEKNDVT